MNKNVITELLDALDVLASECDLNARKVDALEEIVQRDQALTSLAYRHSFGRVAYRERIAGVTESLAKLREILLLQQKD
jgi:hypothetical protein